MSKKHAYAVLLKFIIFNDCSSLVHVYTMIHVFIDWNFMEVMASAKRYNVLSYAKGVVAVRACLVSKYCLSGYSSIHTLALL